jgi:hypothetical protein
MDVPLTVVNAFVPRPVRESVISSRWIPARTAQAMAPERGRPAAELRDELLRCVQDLETLLASNGDLDFGALVIEHPLLGTNNVPELLRLFVLHEQRHQSQIEEILSTSARDGHEAASRFSTPARG